MIFLAAQNEPQTFWQFGLQPDPLVELTHRLAGLIGVGSQEGEER